MVSSRPKAVSSGSVKNKNKCKSCVLFQGEKRLGVTFFKCHGFDVNLVSAFEKVDPPVGEYKDTESPTM